HTFPACVTVTHTGGIGFVHELDSRTGPCLEPGGSWNAALLIFHEGSWDIARPPVEHSRKCPRILNALARPRGKEGDHRMCGVPQKRYAAGGPIADRVPVIHSGDEAALNLIHHRSRARLYICE